METMEKTEMKPKMAYDSVYNRYIKRLLDIVITGVALCFLWPFFLIISLLIAIEDGFPVFYRADRGGYMEHIYRLCKVISTKYGSPLIINLLFFCFSRYL